ncbi:MAG: ABC transporter ATP-binding protein, partial [Anaerolineales bacterium]|nr:ABC transporter ATP-binding protein [Anaerolineales bacterium]
MSEQEFDLRETVSNNRVLGLWRITRGFRLIYLLAVVALAIATLARTGIFYLLRYFVDDVLQQPDTGLIVVWMALGFIVLALIQGGFTFISGRWAARTAEGIGLRLRNFLYNHIQRLTFTYHDQTQTGELLQRATSDVDAMRLFFSEQAIGVGRILLMLFVNWAGIYLLSPYLAWMSVIVIPIIIVASLFFFKKVGEVFDAFQEQEAVLSNRLQENLSGVRVVKAFARQDYEMKRFDVENRQKYRTGVRFAYMHGTFWPVTDILCSAQMLF